jgi:hypothetical protein
MQYGKRLFTLKIALAIVALTLVCTPNTWAQYQLIYSFPGGAGGWGPSSTLVADASGNLYGTTAYGGNTACDSSGYGCGVVYKLSLSQGVWTETVLYTFNGGSDGKYPSSGLILDPKGNLYGETEEGGYMSGQECGVVGCGVVYKLSPTKQGWSEHILYAFTGYDSQSGNQDGASPIGGLVFKTGKLYGVTNDFSSGTWGAGRVFTLSRNGNSWTKNDIHVFLGQNGDGLYPEAGIILDASGNVYGTTTEAGAGGNCCGIVFELTPDGQGGFTETVPYAFPISGDQGLTPNTTLAMDSKGNLYGTTFNGGVQQICVDGEFGCGTVFELQKSGSSWTESLLYAFQGGTDGAVPRGTLVFHSGKLYGTTYEGGNGCPAGFTCGVVFDLAKTNGSVSETVLHTFGGPPDGWLPTAGLLYHNGLLYGTTYKGGNGSCTFASYGCGTVFTLIP